MEPKEVKEIAEKVAAKVAENQEGCICAGMSLLRDVMGYKKATPIIFPINLRGVVYGDDLKVPHSELAIHTGAAGKKILAFALTGSSSGAVVFDDGKGGCDFTFGSNSELFTPPLIEKVREIWEQRGPD